MPDAKLRRCMAVSRASQVIRPLRAVVFQEGDWLCAQFLEYDIATQAKNLEDLYYEIQRIIVGHVATSLAHGKPPFAGVPRAPQKYWKMFQRSKIALPIQKLGFRGRPRGMKIDPPELRVVSAA